MEKKKQSKAGKTILEKPVKPVRLRWAKVNKRNNPYSYYRCSCGKEFVARDEQVRSGKTSSCGCFAKKVRAHNSQSIHIKKHLKEVEDLNEVEKRKLLKEKYSKQYSRILIELSQKKKRRKKKK